MIEAGKSLCSLLKMVSAAFHPEAVNTPHDVKMLYQKVEEIVQKNLAAVATQISGEDNFGSMISFVLYIIKTLSDVHKNLINPSNLVHVLQRLARDIGLSSGSYARQVCPCFPVRMLSNFTSRLNKINLIIHLTTCGAHFHFVKYILE